MKVDRQTSQQTGKGKGGPYMNQFVHSHSKSSHTSCTSSSEIRERHTRVMITLLTH
ncbi:hypothetical protein PISMIDRAFT_676789 [Pisolithus microcarpus 441]|uniref:Uncharacterized protein n=1 Tax=Pisolithus microcarpus 441 TaxID=765257 RepID=A0A0C9Z960_9AGAM|nr:hypothetical protein PISMIDRAFT_676789 [Pisolithus microcarpus 441]